MLDHDFDVKAGHVQGLTGREAVRAFFAQLGYDVGRGHETYADAEGMNEKLAEAVKHVELVARDQDELLDVYLIEFPSVTVARINDLASHFRNRAGECFLTVLTSDYQRLDFVLFERQIPTSSGGPTPAVRMIPRRLSVDRLHDACDRVVRRVLRRLSWTQTDALAQADKLRSAFAIGEWSEEFFDNRGLFADYFLKERLPELPEVWGAEGLKEARPDIGGALVEARDRFRDANEAEVRKGLLGPLLAKLGFRAEVRKGPGDPRRGVPDYELLDPETGKKLAVCAAYQWDRFLDGPDPRDKATEDENPGATVLTLLEQGGNDWAVVTNGKHWRLYTRKTESRATNFLQVDAEEAAADSDADAFRYFWLLFRAEAFKAHETVVAGETRSLTLHEKLLDGSRDYAKQVGDRLKERVFTGHSGQRDEGIFPILAEGFVHDIRAREGKDADLSDERLDLVGEATLLLLYRLLFLLYAESRDLLPVREVGGYFEKSLTALKREIEHAGGTVEGQRDESLKASGYSAVVAASGLPSSGKGATQPSLYARLGELFEVVAKGRDSLNMPQYNGGLFLPDLDDAADDRERATTEFLATHSLPDLCLARAIDRLARDVDDKTHGLAMIDYKSLGVRQLGSIYEGLLEFRVRIAEAKMAVCTQKGAEVVLPDAEAVKTKGVKIRKLGKGKDAPEHILKPGAVYIENSKHERKATGSYYTPEYIVNYIVEHTVGPVLEEKLGALRDDLDRACKDFRKLAKAKREGGMAVPEAVLPAERDLVARVFEMRVLDPAMGSGHFLVTSVDFIADRLIHFLNGFPGNPVERLLRETRRQVLEDVARHGIAIDEARLTDVNLLKRHVLKRCIYGVDLNPMAVELAKVSLWLHCFTLGAPLSFLDHHLKCGNSLIGEVATGKAALPGTSRWDEFSRAVSNYLLVSELADATAGQVLTSRRQFSEAEKLLEEPRCALDILTARHFERWRDRDVGAAQLAAGDPSQPGRVLWNKAQTLSEDHGFFHWPLRFPEVWYGRRAGTETVIEPKANDEAGFDAVVGNPPWGLALLTPEEVAYCRRRFEGGSMDGFALFLERNTSLSGDRRDIGQIVPSGWQTAHASATFRHLILSRVSPTFIVNLPYDVFPEAYVDTTIVIGQRVDRAPDAPSTTHVLTYGRKEHVAGVDERDPRWGRASAAQWFAADMPGTPRLVMPTYLTPRQLSLIGGVHRVSVPLRDLADVQRGITPFDVRPARTASAKSRALDGDLARYRLEGGLGFVEYHAGIAEHKPDRYFVGPRLLLRELISRRFRLQAALATEDFVTNKSVQSILANDGSDLLFLLALLNSALLSYVHVRCSAVALRDDFPKIVLDETRSLPIRQVDRANPSSPSGADLSKTAIAAVDSGDFGTPAILAATGLSAHAALHGPAGKPELREQEPWRTWIAEADTSFPGREDFVHDLLAMLAQRMMDLNREKHDEIDRFVGWLQQELQVEVDELPKKTHITGYNEADFQRLRAALKANQKHLAAPIDGPFGGRLQAEFEASMAKLGPLEDALQKTDRLIDQIVYRLYGLTDEEIAIVEGSAAGGKP